LLLLLWQSFVDIFKYIDTFNWLTFVIGTTSAVTLVLYDIFVRVSSK
jgi:hypothetical protein